LYKKSPQKRAIELFGRFNIWDTEHNNGVLIYLLLADHDFEIIADRGIHQLVGNAGWERISQQMELMFKRGDFEAGVLFGVAEIGVLLTLHYPAKGENNNELSNATIIL
ncbi:MAG: TPM domain-containing protein, partial [Methylotenera sp.]